jgi:hypothetical protein
MMKALVKIVWRPRLVQALPDLVLVNVPKNTSPNGTYVYMNKERIPVEIQTLKQYKIISFRMTDPLPRLVLSPRNILLPA